MYTLEHVWVQCVWWPADGAVRSYEMANDLGRERGVSVSVLAFCPQNRYWKVFKEFSQYISVLVMTHSWINLKHEMWCSSFAERRPFYTFVLWEYKSHFFCYLRTSLLQPLACSTPPPSPPSCVYTKQLIRIADVFFFLQVLQRHLSVFWSQPSVSEASLGFRDVDFDAVCTLRGGVLAKGRSLFGGQQPLTSFLPLLLRWSRRRWGRGVGALLAAQQRSSLTGLLWRWRGRLVLLLEWGNMTRRDRDRATDKRVRECHVEPDQEALFAYADGTWADRVV